MKSARHASPCLTFLFLTLFYAEVSSYIQKTASFGKFTKSETNTTPLYTCNSNKTRAPLQTVIPTMTINSGVRSQHGQFETWRLTGSQPTLASHLPRPLPVTMNSQCVKPSHSSTCYRGSQCRSAKQH